MKKVLFLLLMMMTQLATFAENESDYRDADDEVRNWGESDGFQIHLGFRHRERTRKPYTLEPGYRCFISGELLIFDDIASRISTTHGMQLDNRFFIGAGLGLLSSEFGVFDYYSIPFFSVFRVDFLKKKITPFLEARGGYDLVINAESGFYGGLSFGCRLKRVSISLGAEKMPENSYKEYVYYENNNDDSLLSVEEYVYRGWNFNLRFSYEFSKHR